MQKIPFFVLTLLRLAAFALSLAACKTDTEEPMPAPIAQQPNPLPVNALVKEVKWSENDHLTATYDAQNRMAQVRTQWQYDESDPTKIRSIVYDFQYNAQGKVTKIAYTNGFKVNVFYTNQLVEKAQELYPGGDVLSDFTYLYNNKRIVGIIRKSANAPSEPPTTYRYDLCYDSKGNLNQIKTSEQLKHPVNGSAYKLLETTTYSDFDDKVNTLHWQLQFPFLPQVRWQFNNPCRKEVKTEGGDTLVYTYTYTYDAKGLPTEQRERVGGFARTAVIAY